MTFLEKYESLRNIHSGSSIIVSGCGTSAVLAKEADCIRIGVNDIGRLYMPDYLVVVNDKKSFKESRWMHIRNTTAKVFTHIAKPQARENLEIDNTELIIPIKLGRYAGTNIGSQFVDYTSNSPYVGVMIAKHLGAKRIGLIGVDFTKDHFFAKTGDHALSKRLPAIITEYNALRNAMSLHGTELFNLSPHSMLQLPRMDINDFLRL